MSRYLDWLTLGIFKRFQVKVSLLNVEHLGLKHNGYVFATIIYMFSKPCS